ncbi:MAG: ComF family protein [Candidatus Omnitrophica bacterium]|nr:ComF family protein [Candidatus Omnitrophota bacterium]
MRNFLTRYELRFSTADMIIPVPLHATRMRERGYNQAELLAERAADILGKPLQNGLLVRHRYTPRQSELGQKERLNNIANAFSIKSRLQIQGKSVILVDDLLTTGATASSAAGALKAAGASKVTLLTLSIA